MRFGEFIEDGVARNSGKIKEDSCLHADFFFRSTWEESFFLRVKDL